jgi:hypothetical protein
MFRIWLRRLFKRTPAAVGTRRPFGRQADRPGVEWLEDRTLLTGPTSTMVALQVPSTLIVNQPTTLTAMVTPSSGTLDANTLVQFVDDSNPAHPVILGDAAVHPGSDAGTYTATLITAFDTGSGHSIQAVYLGDANFSGSTGASSVTVNASPTTTVLGVLPSPAQAGQEVTLTATVTSPNGTPDSNVVNFIDDSTPSSPVILGSATTDAQGVATWTGSFAGVGTHDLMAQYESDANFMGSSSQDTSLTINAAGPASTMTALSVPSGTTPAVGQQVMLTATVTSPGGTPDMNTVDFIDDSNPADPVILGAVSTDDHGVATWTGSFANTGTHQVLAHYEPDANFSASDSSDTALTVDPAATTTVLAAQPSTGVEVGDEVTLTATVSAAAGAGTPTGMVTFTDQTTNTTLGTAALDGSGVATASFPLLSVGPHMIQASYAATTNYAASNDSTTEVVGPSGPATTTTALAVQPGTTVAVGQQVMFTATVTSPGVTPDTNTVDFIDDSNPAAPVILGTAATNAQGIATWTTSFAAALGHSIVAHYEADAGFGASDSSAAGITVNPATDTLTLAAQPATTIDLGQSLTFQATVAPAQGTLDAGTMVQFYDDTNPGSPVLLGAASVDPSSGVATLHYTFAGTGDYSVVAHFQGDPNFVATDSGATPIAVDQAPAFSSGNHTTFTTGMSGTFTVAASGFPAPTFSETGSLPGGVNFDQSTGVLSGTPDATSGGVYTLHITASNGVSPDATQMFTLTVDQPPAVTTTAGTLTVGQSGNVTITTSGFPKPSLTETGALPMGVNFTDNGNGTATLGGTPAAGMGGTYSVTITAHNGVGADASQTFTLTVDQAAAFTSVASATFPVGTANSFTVAASGTPAPTLSEVGTPPAGVTFNANTGVLSVSAATATGTYHLTFTAHNGVGADATQNFTLTVDQAPAFTSAASATFPVGAANNFTVTASGFPAPTLSEVGAPPAGVTFNASTGVLSVSPSAAVGTYHLTFNAHNGAGADASQNFTLSIVQAPTFTSPSVATFAAGSAGSFTVAATGSPAPTLSESPTDVRPAGVTFNPNTGVLSGTPDATSGGVYTLHFTAHNGAGADATQTVTLTVNQAPAFTNPASTTFTAGLASGVQLTAAGFPIPTFSERPGDVLPAGVTFDAATGVLSGTPVFGSGGVYTLHFTAHNGSGDATQTFTLMVNDTQFMGPVTSGAQVQLVPMAPLPGHHKPHGFNGILMLTNTGASPLRGPLYVVFRGLATTIKVSNVAGFLRLTKKKKVPFVALNPAGGVLNPGETVTLALHFSARPNVAAFFQFSMFANMLPR